MDNSGKHVYRILVLLTTVLSVTHALPEYWTVRGGKSSCAALPHQQFSYGGHLPPMMDRYAYLHIVTISFICRCT